MRKTKHGSKDCPYPNLFNGLPSIIFLFPKTASSRVWHLFCRYLTKLLRLTWPTQYKPYQRKRSVSNSESSTILLRDGHVNPLGGEYA